MSAMDPLADQDKLRKVLSGQSMELCNFLQNVVAITYIFGLQQPTFLLCNFLHLYFATNMNEYGDARNPDGSRVLESVSCGGESGPKARDL